nr:MAG: replication associated protein [Cressdnaviricota sp.]
MQTEEIFEEYADITDSDLAELESNGSWTTIDSEKEARTTGARLDRLREGEPDPKRPKRLGPGRSVSPVAKGKGKGKAVETTGNLQETGEETKGTEEEINELFPEHETRGGKFRFNAKRLLLTYSQCNKTPQEVFEFLNNKDPLKYWSIGQEHHQDGNLHVHAYVEYVNKLNVLSARHWDFAGFHPNIRSVKRTWTKAAAYTRKENGNVVTNIDLNLIDNLANERKNKMKDEILPLVEEGKSLLEIFATNKAFVASNRKKVSDLIELEKQWKESQIPPIEPLVNFHHTWDFIPLLQVLPLTTKKRHLWIWSKETNRGKSTFCDELIAEGRAARLANTELYQSKNLPRGKQFYILDPFNGGVYTYYHLESICDGSFSFPVKSNSPIELGKFILIICCNVPIRERFPNMFAVLEARFNEFCVDEINE